VTSGSFEIEYDWHVSVTAAAIESIFPPHQLSANKCVAGVKRQSPPCKSNQAEWIAANLATALQHTTD